MFVCALARKDLVADDDQADPLHHALMLKERRRWYPRFPAERFRATRSGDPRPGL
jgi:hypothetical protein